jgi:dodecin
MSKLVKAIEVLSQSETSWEDAAKNALAEAKKTLRNIRSIYVKEFEAKGRTMKSSSIGSTPRSHSISKASKQRNNT